MSAFIVDYSTINQILRAAKNSGITKRLLGFDTSSYADLAKLGQTLLDMNYDAVNQRYRENDTPETFQLNPQILRQPIGSDQITLKSSVQALKSLHCYLYQCAEGDVYGSDPYKEIEQFSLELASRLLKDMPIYDTAEWG